MLGLAGYGIQATADLKQIPGGDRKVPQGLFHPNASVDYSFVRRNWSLSEVGSPESSLLFRARNHTAGPNPEVAEQCVEKNNRILLRDQQGKDRRKEERVRR